MWFLFSKYVLVGVANTALTLGIIFVLMYYGVGMYYANFAGYVAGIVLSFLLNSTFTFSSQISIYRLVKFFLSCLICYGINILAIKTVLIFFPEMKYLAQLCGMGFYTVSGFIINKIWVMR